MGAIEDALADLDMAFEDLLTADVTGSADHRRMLRAVLACLYEVRAYREGGDDSSFKRAYRARVAASTAGHIAEGIVWLRGLATHSLTHDVAPGSPLWPSKRLFPSKYLFPGTNACWRSRSQLPFPKPPNQERNLVGEAAYMSHVEGWPILPTLHVARRFLASDPGPAT